MNTATITQASNTELRHRLADTFARIRGFAAGLYAAHGGWSAHGAARDKQSLAHMMILGTACEHYAPVLATDMLREKN